MDVRAELGGLTTAWDELVDAAPLPTPFLRTWWLGAWPAGVIAYLCVLDGEALVGGMPLRRERSRVERYADVGVYLGGSNLDLLTAPGRGPQVAAAVHAWASSTGARSFRVRAVNATSRLVDALPGARVEPFGDTLVHPLQGDHESYLATRPKGLAKRIRRARSALEQAGVRHTVLDDPDPVGAVYDRFLSHHELAFGARSTLLPYADIAGRAIRAGAAAGEVVAHVLVRDDQALAVELCFEVGGRLTLWHGAREPSLHGAGNVLMAEAVRRAFDRGLVELDIGFSGAPYKTEWADQARPTVTVTAGNGPVARLDAAVATVRTRAVGGVRHRWNEWRHRP